MASIKPKAQDPQEANKEENKDATDFVEEVTNACKEFMDDKKVFEAQCDEQVISVARQRNGLQELQQ